MFANAKLQKNMNMNNQFLYNLQIIYSSCYENVEKNRNNVKLDYLI